MNDTIKNLQIHIKNSRKPEKRMGKIQVQFIKHIYVNEILLWAVVWYNACTVCIEMERDKEV